MADNFYARYPNTGGGVSSLNGLTGALTLIGAGGITITPAGTNITIDGSNFANRALSNLTATAINASLISDTDGIYDLGSQSLRWQNAYIISLVDASGIPQIALSARNLYDSANVSSMDWDLRHLNDSTNLLSINYDTRLLYDATGTAVLSWFFSGIKLSTNLVPDAVGTRNVGTSGTPFLGMASNSFFVADNFGDIIGTIQQSSGGAGVGTGIHISANFASGPSFYGPIILDTANNGSGPSGDITMTTGTATTTRGSIRMDALVLALPVHTADPSGTFTGGEIYYNSTTTTVRFYNGTTWGDL